MRQIIHHQLPLAQEPVAHDHARELEMIGALLDRIPEVLARVREDLLSGRGAGRGRPGLTASQALRSLIVKQMNSFSYVELEFHLADSRSYRTFCGFGAFDAVPRKSTLQENIKRISSETLEQVNRMLMSVAREMKIERGAKLRIDCTPTESNIHRPTDSCLLWDVVRVLGRLMKRAETFGVRFTDRRRSAKRRWWEITNTKKPTQRVLAYRKLVAVTEETLDEARRVSQELRRWHGSVPEELMANRLAKSLDDVMTQGERIVDQTRRRVFQHQSVPAGEKVISIFEPHTDIIVKGPGDPVYGHKVCLTAGVSGLVTDCVVHDGNPADSTMAIDMVERAIELFGTPPRQVAFDGGFASQPNLTGVKALGVADVAFSKRCGLAINEMVKSTWVYKRLRNFRAGIEGCISLLKRCFGMARCSWSGASSFRAYVWSSIVSANVVIMARHLLAADNP
jgi:IS5 family transposase